MSVKREVNYRSEQVDYGVRIVEGSVILCQVASLSNIYAFTPDEALAVSELLAAAAGEVSGTKKDVQWVIQPDGRLEAIRLHGTTAADEAQGKQGAAKVRRFKSLRDSNPNRHWELDGTRVYECNLTGMSAAHIEAEGMVEITDGESGQGEKKWRYFKRRVPLEHDNGERWRMDVNGNGQWKSAATEEWVSTGPYRDSDFSVTQFIEVAENE